MSEKYTNNGASTLNGGINNSTTTVIVTSAASFPTTGNFRILIDSEIMLVTAVSTNTFTVTRAHENTSAASHSDLAVVTHIFTAGAIDAIRSDQIQVGAYGSRPSAGKAGNVYIANDGPYLSHDNGSVWSQYGPISKVVPIVTGDFSWNNQLSATETVYGGAVVLATEASRASPSVASRIKTAPSAPYTVTMCFRVAHKPTTSGGLVNSWGGMILRESGTDKRLNMGIFQNDSPNRVVSFSQTSATSAISTVTNLIISITSPIWFQVSNDNTNLIWRYSADGYQWQQIATEAKTSHFTTAPDQIGYCLNQELMMISVYSWIET